MGGQDIIAGTYRMIRPIGSGGTGTVFLAEHLNLRKKVVLKKIKSSLKSSAVVRQEADILKSLHHMYLPQVYDFIEYEGQVYTVIDYIEGQDLETLFQSGAPVSEERLLKWMTQLCDALSYLHSRKPAVYHNDIKPANIILTPSDDICLIDFNISTDAEEEVLGFTQDYASPEQYYRVLGMTDSRYSGYIRNIDGRSDLYSLGASVYALVSRVRPNVYNAVTGTLSPLDPAQCGLSEGMCRIINKLMSPDPDHRYPSAAELKKALNREKRKSEGYRRYLAAQACVLLLSGLMVVSGILLMVYGVRSEHRKDFNKAFSEFSTAYSSGDYSRAAGKGQDILSEKEWERFIGEGRKSSIEHKTAMSFYELGQFSTAAEYADSAVSHETDSSVRSVYELDSAVIYAGLGDYGKAWELVGNAVSDGAEGPAVELTYAQIYYASGAYDNVIACCDNSSIQQLGDDAALRMLELKGDSQLKKGDRPGAAETLEQAFGISGGLSPARKLGELYFGWAMDSPESERAELLEKSGAYYKYAAENSACTVEDLVNLAKVRRAAGDSGSLRQGQQELSQGASKFPEDYRIWQQLAIINYRLGQVPETSDCVRKALDLYDRLPPEERESPNSDDMTLLYSIRDSLS